MAGASPSLYWRMYMIVSHFDSETKQGFTAIFSDRYGLVLEMLRRQLSPLDFAFAQKVGLALFDRHESESVILAGMVAPFLDRLDAGSREPHTCLEPHELGMAESALEIFAHPFEHQSASASISQIVHAIVQTWLTESRSEAEEHESTLRTAAELAELRSQFERSIQTTDLDDKIKAWCSLHNIDPEWLWSKRPVYCISINGEHKQEDEEALQRVRRLAENTGFFHIRKEDRILVRASSALQQLLDRLAVSIAAHEPQLVVEIAEEFPKNADAWQRKILTIDNKPAIYRRVALQKTKAIDPYPAMLKV